MPKKDAKEKLTLFQKFGLFFFDHKKTSLFVWITLVVFGIFCYTSLLKREGFPSVSPPFSIVSGTYFVNDRAKVDSEAVKPLGEIIAQRDDVKRVISQSGDNFFVLQIQYVEGTDAQQASNEIEQQVKEKSLLPQGSFANFQPFSFSIAETQDGDDILIAVYDTNNTKSYEQLYADAQTISTQITDNKLIPLAQRVRPFEFFKEGINPFTKQNVKQQTVFDRVGIKQGDGTTIFYPSVVIGVQGVDGVDELELYEETQQAIETINNESSQNGGTNLKVVADLAEQVEAQIESLQHNLRDGLIAILIISLLLVSLRASIVTALAMTTVLTITIAVLWAVGYTLNTITLFSLILCLGLIVDDTIIVTEAIDAGRGTKKKKRDVVSLALKKVGLASGTGTFTTMLAFAPMLFISGVLGSFIIGIPVTIIISLALSLVVSMSLIPFLSGFLLRPNKSKFIESAGKLNPFPYIENFLSGLIAKGIRVMQVSKKKGILLGLSFIALSIAMVMGSGYFFQKGVFNIFPAGKDSDSLSVKLTFAPDTSIQQAESISKKAEAITISTLGDNIRRASYYASGKTEGAKISVDLISYKERDAKSPELISNLETAFENFEEARVEVGQADAGPPQGAFSARIYSEDAAKANNLAGDIKKFLEGKELNRLDGSAVVIQQTSISNPNFIVRDNNERFTAVDATFDATDTSTLVTLAQQAVEKEFTPDRVKSYGLEENALRFDYGSESDNQESFKSMIIAFPILLVVMFIVLAILFRSLMQPLLIFMAIPFSFFGVSAGLYYTDNPLSFFVMLGFFALIGISVNNTILLTDYANQERKAGVEPIEAMAVAVQKRFRPLVTTSLTSVVALIPLALSDPFWESLAYTLIFGLLSSTFLVVVAFPYYYLAVEWLRNRFSARKTLGWIAILIVSVVLAGKFIGPNAIPIVILSVFIAMFVVKFIKKGRKTSNA